MKTTELRSGLKSGLFYLQQNTLWCPTAVQCRDFDPPFFRYGKIRYGTLPTYIAGAAEDMMNMQKVKTVDS